MRIRERTCGGLLWALSSFLLLVGILSMHGLTSHDVAMAWMDPASVGHEDHPRLSPVAPGAAPMSVMHPDTDAPDPGVTSTAATLTWSSSPQVAGHGVMDLCVAVLSLLLLLNFLVRAHGELRRRSGRGLLRSFRRMAGRAPPHHLRPSLTGLCVARV